MIRLLAALAVVGLVVAICASSCEDEVCYEGHYASITSYDTAPNLRTKEGIAVRYEGDQVGDSTRSRDSFLADVDRRTDAVEQCLRGLYPGGQLPVPVIAEGHCVRSYFDTSIHRSCMRVVVAPDSHYGCGGEQVFPCKVDPQLCRDKGLTPTEECPCECRSIIQDDRVVVTTPDLHLYDAELIRLVTGCNNIWVQGLQECWKP